MQELPVLPDITTRDNGENRRVGTEIEFTGLSIATAAALVSDAWGGRIRILSDYEYMVEDSEYGDFRIELDFDFLKKRGQSRRDGDTRPSDIERLTEDVLATAAKQVVPCEIVSPPMEISSLPKLDELCKKLAEKGALGTGHSVFYAFGVHFNPEIPKLEPKVALAYLQAFIVLSEWIIKSSKIDWSRRASTFADPFPRDYAKKVLAADYSPDWDSLIDDYIDGNPTRNRGLDMLPLFAHVDEERVRARLDNALIKARPTFHYRLPNCRLGEADWSILQEWQYWLAVERLANDNELRSELMEEYRRLQESTLSRWLTDWSKRMDEVFDA